MRPLLRHLIAVVLLLSLTAAAGAEAGRLPIPIRRPSGLPIGPHLPIPIGPHLPGHAGGDSDNSWIYLLLGLGAFALFCRLEARRAKSETSQPARDLIHPAEKVAPKAERTRRLMEVLAQRDRLFDPTALRSWAEESFLRVQECWQKGDYGPLGDLLLPQIRALHESQMATMRANGLRNVLRYLRVKRLEFVHLVCPADPDQQQVTALITFRAASSYVDARTGAFRQGSQVPTLFQELWSFRLKKFGKRLIEAAVPTLFQELWIFRRQGDAWHLDWIKQSRISDLLTSRNYVEGLSEEQLRHAEECVAP